MFENLFKGVTTLFGEGNYGLSTDYVPLKDIVTGDEKLFKHLPYLSYDKDYQLFLNRGSTGFVLLATPLAGSSLQLQDKIEGFFKKKNHLPLGCSMQFLLVASPRIKDKLDYWKSYRTNSLFAGVTQKRYEFLTEKAFCPVSPIRDFKLLISYSLPDVIEDPLQKEKLARVRDTLKATLEKMGVFSEVLDDRGLIREVGNIINFEEKTEADKCWYSEHEEISRLIPSFNLNYRNRQEGLYMRNDRYVAHTFVPKSTPREWGLAHMDKLFGDVLKGDETIPCPFLLHYGFTVSSDQGKQKKKLSAKKETLEKTCHSPMAKWQVGLEKQYEEVNAAYREIDDAKNFFIESCLSLTVMCKSKDLISVKSDVETIWSEYSWAAESADQNHLHLFLGCLPMMWTTDRLTVSGTFGLKEKVVGMGSTLRDRGITRKALTTEVPSLLPMVGEWTGQRAPGIPLVGRRGQLMFWNPFNGEFIPGREMYKSTANKNCIIVGPSGSGKSFACNEIITNVLAVGGKAFVIDKGRSFKPNCLNHGGQHINCTGEQSFSLNPFSKIPTGTSKSESDDRSDMLDGLKSIVKTMAFRSGQKDEAGFLGEAITNTWSEYGTDGSIDKIYDYLFKNPDSRAKDIARCLLPFTSQGAYGPIFNPPSDIDLNNDFVVVETDDLPKDLLPVMTMVMITHIWKKMVSSDRNTPFLVLIDEAWELLAGDEAGEFISKLVRTARKYRCALVIATQNLSDFHDGAPGPQAAWTNSDSRLIFRQTDDVVTSLKDNKDFKEFVSTPYRERLLRSLPEADTYSEFLLYSSAVSGAPCRLYVDPYTAFLYSTSGSEVSLLNNLQKSGKTLHESIEYAVFERQRRAS